MLFSIRCDGDDVPSGKPDPGIYRLAAERLQESPERLLAVEDAASGVKSPGPRLAVPGSGGCAASPLLQEAGADPVIPDFRSFSFRNWKSISTESLPERCCTQHVHVELGRECSMKIKDEGQKCECRRRG